MNPRLRTSCCCVARPVATAIHTGAEPAVASAAAWPISTINAAISWKADFNNWKGRRQYAGVMANQSLHHVLNLESLFDAIKKSLHPRGYFVTSDMVGRNGHQRWPEALVGSSAVLAGIAGRISLQRPAETATKRSYENWDCSVEALRRDTRTGDRAALLLKRFHFHLYIGFANVIDVFIDRSPTGHHFDAEGEWDRDFVDRVHALDEQALRSGTLTPTHMMAVMRGDEALRQILLSRNCAGAAAAFGIRPSDRNAGASRPGRATSAVRRRSRRPCGSTRFRHTGRGAGTGSSVPATIRVPCRFFSSQPFDRPRCRQSCGRQNPATAE